MEDAVALAGLAAAAPDVEAEPSRAVAPHFGVLRLGKDRADVIEHAGIGGGVGAGRAADGLLVDADDLIHELEALYPIALASAGAGAVQLTGEGLIQNLVDEARLARAGDARHADELAQRKFYVDVAQIVFARTLHREEIAVARAAGLRHLDALAARQIVAGDAALGLADVLDGACGHDLAAVDARARADVHDIIGAAHGILVVLDHDDRIAEVAEIFQRCDEFIVVALVQADGRLIQHVQHTRQSASDLGGQADALALAAGQGAC